jgi:5-formyltetrahydrofolate cyclo-ligase
MFKKDIRVKYKELRHSLSENQIEELSLAIANEVLLLPIWEKTYFHIFLTIEEQKEVNTEYILHLLSGKDKEICISKSDFETLKMTTILLTDNTKIKKNEYNIPEPVDVPDASGEVPSNKMEVVFIPLLAYDKKGNRVGYGKGFYDKFLAECNPNTIKIGLSFFDPEELILDVNPTDIQLNYCVTPNRVLNFSDRL